LGGETVVAGQRQRQKAESSMDAFIPMLLLLITHEQLTQILQMFNAVKTVLAI